MRWRPLRDSRTRMRGAKKGPVGSHGQHARGRNRRQGCGQDPVVGHDVGSLGDAVQGWKQGAERLHCKKGTRKEFNKVENSTATWCFVNSAATRKQGGGREHLGCAGEEVCLGCRWKAR